MRHELGIMAAVKNLYCHMRRKRAITVLKKENWETSIFEKRFCAHLLGAIVGGRQFLCQRQQRKHALEVEQFLSEKHIERREAIIQSTARPQTVCDTSL